jgi:hypothetical protein
MVTLSCVFCFGVAAFAIVGKVVEAVRDANERKGQG